MLRSIIHPVALMVLLAACTEPGTYPISGEPCSESDPVHSMAGSDCAVASVGGGGF